jgi:DNA-3-methyladenine glycosylase II
VSDPAVHLSQADPVMAGIIARVGVYCPQYRKPEFATLARAVVFQQLNGRAAATIFARLMTATGQRRLTPKSLLRTPMRKLRAAGLSAQKAAYLRDLAAKTAGGALRFRRLPAMSDDDVIAALTQVKGVGVWTAHMFLLFALRRPDVLATGDYAVRAAVQKAYGLPKLPTPAEVERIAQPWRPHSSAACWYLWRSLERKE